MHGYTNWFAFELKAVQPKVMKLAARFELLIQQRRQCAECKDQSDEEILSMLIQRYNSFKANAALKLWQLNGDAQSAIFGIISGMSTEARSLVRQHLDFNKYEESGFFENKWQDVSGSFILVLNSSEFFNTKQRVYVQTLKTFRVQ